MKKLLSVCSLILSGFMMSNLFSEVALAQQGSRPDVAHDAVASNGGQWGSWTRAVYCPTGSYASGYTMRVEPSLGGGNNDDTALNAIRLYCRVPNGGRFNNGSDTVVIEAHPGFWGTWVEGRNCPGNNDFMTTFNLRVERSLGGGLGSRDDTAANSVAFRCSSGEVIEAEGGPWGDWGREISGPRRSAICGLAVKVEPQQGQGDDTALNDVQFFWCRR